MDRSRESNALWFIAGAALGATVALLYAPYSGSETRSRIASTAREGRDKLNEYGTDVYDRGRELFDRGRGIADEAAGIFERGKRLVEG